ncbi:adenylyltransferase/cytidyltransferase family protein [Bacillus vallismortis]|uniref:adenylyltransferase/cytidyltransferase family protein n=1 Tax=Bacillus vallismortis TaxID=72361 RepID=UPI002280861B|nr:adenylyltransferase/cytidyltransferase family protein [Bacillus vallismortis]MCY7916890.1 adenylyltransferase/cytidyltransferase family protein [Bacillus vallismortis]
MLSNEESYTYGTFDLFHYGHMKLLERAKNRGDYFIVRSTKEYCEIIYLPRTEGISTTQIKKTWLV